MTYFYPCNDHFSVHCYVLKVSFYTRSISSNWSYFNPKECMCVCVSIVYIFATIARSSQVQVQINMNTRRNSNSNNSNSNRYSTINTEKDLYFSKPPSGQKMVSVAVDITRSWLALTQFFYIYWGFGNEEFTLHDIFALGQQWFYVRFTLVQYILHVLLSDNILQTEQNPKKRFFRLEWKKNNNKKCTHLFALNIILYSLTEFRIKLVL